VRLPAILLFLACSAASALEFGDKPFQARPLEFEVDVPKGWDATSDHRALVARAPDGGPAFRITREPMLWERKELNEIWEVQLEKAGVKHERIRPERAGRDKGWRTEWTVGGRRIIAVRIHAEANEMLYNFAFSVPKDYDAKDLVDTVLRSFECKAKKRPELRFKSVQFTPWTLSGELPDFLEKQGGRFDREPRFAKVVKGYATPHVAVEVRLGVVQGQEPEAVAAGAVTEKLEKLTGAERSRARKDRIGRRRGYKVHASGVVEGGIVKEGEAFVWGNRRQSIFLIVVADERETRLYDDLIEKIFEKVLG